MSIQDDSADYSTSGRSSHTAASAILDNLVIALSDQIDRVIPGTGDPLEEAAIGRMDHNSMDEQAKKTWDGINATSMTLRLAEGVDFQIHVIKVPPHLVQR